MASGYIDKLKMTGSRTGSGPVTGWVRIPPYRLPTDVKAITDRVFLEVRDVNDDTIWEHGWYEIAAGGQLTLYAVVDTHQRAGEYVAGSPPAAISFGGPVEVGAIANSQTLPVIGPDGRLINGKAVRDSVLFPDIVTLQARSDLADGDVFFTMSSLYTPSGGGASTGAGPGLLLQFDADSAAAPDGVNVFDLSSGSPGRLIKASLEVQAQFIRERWSIYADAGGVSRLRQHVLARGAAGADTAWMGTKAQRGADVDPFTEFLIVDNDRHAGLETPFLRARSFGGPKDLIALDKPIVLPGVATKADVLPGRLARVATADKKIWLNDADRGFGEIPLQEGPYRAIVANIADLRLLTPDGYRDGEVVLVEGATFRGDDSFEVYWASASAAADNNSDVYKPDFHASGAAWVEPGRFIAVAPIRAIKFADDDATPSVAGSSVFTGPDVAPVGGITAFDDFRNNKRIKLQPGAVDLVLKQANSALELPGRADFTLASVANGGSPVILEKENGVVSMISGGGAGGQSVADLTALAALGGFGALRDRERVYVKSLSTEYEYRDNLADATDDLIVVPALGGGTKKWGLPTYLKAQGVDLADLGVDPTGATDIYPVLLKAINAAKVRGGMVKFPGSGKFRLATATSLDIAGVKLVGVGKADRNTSDPDASLIEIRQSSVAPFTAGDGTVLEGLSFDYPDQVDSSTPTAYAPLIDGTNWRHGGAYLCHVMRAWDFAHLGGALVNQVCGALEFTGNRIFAINKTLRVRGAPEVIDLDNNHFSVNAIEGNLFPLLDAYSRTNGIAIEIYGASSAAWGFVDGFNMTKTNFIFGKKVGIQVSDGLLNISQVGGLIDGCERWFQVLSTGRVANTVFEGFGWADNAQNSTLTAIELGSTVDAENSLDIQNVNVLNAGGSPVACIGSPAGANHKTKLRLRNCSFRNFGGDDLAGFRYGIFCTNAKAEIFATNVHIQGRSDETSHIGVFADKGTIRLSACQIENLTYPVWARGTAKIVALNVDVFGTKTGGANPAGSAYFTNETGVVEFRTGLGVADKVYDVTHFGAVADGLQSSASRNVLAFDAAVAEAVANGGGIVYWPAAPLEYYITNTRADTGNTFDQVACCIEANNIWVKGAGIGATKIRLADGGNANIFRIGTRLTRLGVKNCRVTDMSLDGNRANQAAVQALTHHFSGVEVCADGGEYCGIERVATKQMQYYGGGVQYGSNGAQNCWVEEFYSEDCNADGFDWKDNGSNGFGNTINGMWIERFGLDGGALTDQAGLDLRTGVKAKNVTVVDYGAVQGLNGIRIQRGAGSNFNQRQASSVDDFYCRPNTNTGTRGVRVTQINAGLSNGEVFETGTAYLVSQRQLKATNCWAYSCVDGWQFQDGIVGETNANNAMLTNCGSQGHTDEGLRLTGTVIGCEFHACHFTTGAKGITIDSGVTNSRFIGGRCAANTTYNLQDGTTFAASNIFYNVEGIGGNLLQIAAGTFTPTVTFGTVGDFVPTYILQQARYFQIGAEVTVFGTVEFTANAYTTAAGEFRIGGLPFTASTALARYAGTASRLENVDWPAGTPWQQVNAEISQSVAYMRLRASRDAAAGFIADVTAFPAGGTYRIDFSVTYTRV